MFLQGGYCPMVDACAKQHVVKWAVFRPRRRSSPVFSQALYEGTFRTANVKAKEVDMENDIDNMSIHGCGQ